MSKQEAGEMRNKDTSDQAKERSTSASHPSTPAQAGDRGPGAEGASEVEINDPFAAQPPESDPALREPGLFAPNLNPAGPNPSAAESAASADPEATLDGEPEGETEGEPLQTATIVSTQTDPEGVLETEAEDSDAGDTDSGNTDAGNTEAIHATSVEQASIAGAENPQASQVEASLESERDGEQQGQSSQPVVYTVTEAARAACVSVQALRQRISRGTLRTTRVVRSGRVVLGIDRDELAQHYAGLLEAVSVGKASSNSSTGSVANPGSGESDSEMDAWMRKRLKPLRRRLERETVARERLLGSVESLQHQITEQRGEIAELVAERRLMSEQLGHLENRLVVLGNGGSAQARSDADASSAVSRFWIRVVVAVVFVVVMTMFGSKFWSELDRRLDAHQRATAAELSTLIEAGTAGAGTAGEGTAEPDSNQR